jgi:hypothetical protein
MAAAVTPPRRWTWPCIGGGCTAGNTAELMAAAAWSRSVAAFCARFSAHVAPLLCHLVLYRHREASGARAFSVASCAAGDFLGF